LVYCNGLPAIGGVKSWRQILHVFKRFRADAASNTLITHVLTHTYTHTCTHTHTNKHIHTQTCKYILAHAHIHIHTHKQLQLLPPSTSSSPHTHLCAWLGQQQHAAQAACTVLAARMEDAQSHGRLLSCSLEVMPICLSVLIKFNNTYVQGGTSAHTHTHTHANTHTHTKHPQANSNCLLQVYFLPGIRNFSVLLLANSCCPI
jgi:hypothetical protein